MDLNNRWFNAQPIHAELSPVTDFREACCRQYEMGSVSQLLLLCQLFMIDWLIPASQLWGCRVREDSGYWTQCGRHILICIIHWYINLFEAIVPVIVKTNWQQLSVQLTMLFDILSQMGKLTKLWSCYKEQCFRNICVLGARHVKLKHHIPRCMALWARYVSNTF